MQPNPEIFQRDGGAWSIGWQDDAAGPFLSRQHAAAVLAKLVNRDNRQPSATVPARRVGR